MDPGPYFLSDHAQHGKLTFAGQFDFLIPGFPKSSKLFFHDRYSGSCGSAMKALIIFEALDRTFVCYFLRTAIVAAVGTSVDRIFARVFVFDTYALGNAGFLFFCHFQMMLLI